MHRAAAPMRSSLMHNSSLMCNRSLHTCRCGVARRLHAHPVIFTTLFYQHADAAQSPGLGCRQHWHNLLPTKLQAHAAWHCGAPFVSSPHTRTSDHHHNVLAPVCGRPPPALSRRTHGVAATPSTPSHLTCVQVLHGIVVPEAPAFLPEMPTKNLPDEDGCAQLAKYDTPDAAVASAFSKGHLQVHCQYCEGWYLPSAFSVRVTRSNYTLSRPEDCAAFSCVF